MSEKCFICNKNLAESPTVVVEHGMKTLIDSSIERNDGKVQYLENKQSIIVHIQCRKVYTLKSNIAAAKRERDAVQASTSTSSPPRTRARLDESTFCFKKFCLFCGNEANEENEKKKPKDRRRVIYQVATISFKDTIVEVAQKRSDNLAKTVLVRIGCEYDLVAAEAKYHVDCFRSFLKPAAGGKIGRPEDYNVALAMEEIYTYIETNEDCQFSLQELKNACKNTTSPDDKTIKKKLKLKYGNKIIITEKQGSLTIICFVDTQHDVLNKAWHENKNRNEREQRFWILKAAAEIIREDIQSVPFDNSNYPPPSQMFDDINSQIPESLTYFLEQTILKNKQHKLDHLKLICTNISHCIMAAIRPRSFISRLQLGLSVFIHRRFGSKRLIQIFSSFELCASYNDTLMYEAATILNRQPHILPPETGTLIQYAADNADINVYTLDGHNTIHIMGIIQIITPKCSVLAEEPLKRVNEMPAAKDFVTKAHMPLQVYQNDGVVGYSKIIAQNFAYERSATVSLPRKVDILWLYGKWNDLLLPGWNGYIKLITSKMMNFELSRILFLPFIHQPASNFNTIYTTLLYAQENLKSYGHDVCIITFDQPLYAKAREIVSAAPQGSELAKIVVRLGGFHLLMSYLGAIGFIMQGSGIKEALSLIYAPNSLEKVLTGHAYARAVRAHTLVHLTLSTIISKELGINDNMHENLKNMIEGVINNTTSYVDIENSDEDIKSLLCQFNEKLKEYERRGPTAKLWIQYFRMVSIAKEFIRAERMGDWQAHLNCVKEMLPYFHASGHFPYAKYAHLYLQDMLQLENSIDPSVFKRFTQGFFTIRRSEKFNCGTSTDMIIEQSLMKSMKTNGGVARGRSTQESVMSKWIYSMHALNTVCEGLEDIANVKMDTTDQHVDASDSRMKRDTADVKKLFEWFSLHDPFPRVQKIMSIANGIIGDDKINCHNAREVGITSMNKMIGKTFNNIKLKRADKVLPLLTVSSAIKVHDEKVPIDPLLLFQRMSVTKAFKNEVEQFFEYELAPYPLSLFDEIGMRKTQKSAIYKCFQCVNVEFDDTDATYIINGGYLLHHVVWDRQQTFDVICDKYIHYVINHYGHNVIVIFDGYGDPKKNIKAAEQHRRATKISSSADVLFDRYMTVPTNQQQFLANTHNKIRFISMLCEKLNAAGISVKQADNDADVLIVETAIEQSNKSTTIVVGEDIDLLILITARTPTDKTIYFLKPGKAQVETKMYSSQSLELYPKCRAHILFLHAITGCDTTSALFRKGKIQIFKLFEKSYDLIFCAEAFKKIDSSPDIIFANGIRFLLAIYGAPKNIDSIDSYRYLSFAKSTRQNKVVQLSCLPPTSGAARQHLYRVYYQVQIWLGNKLDPENWGWELNNNDLEPIKTFLLPAPEILLHTIFCNCTKGCNFNCGCRKVGLFCSAICSNCHGQSCSNVTRNTTDDDSSDTSEEIPDPYDFSEHWIGVQHTEVEEEEGNVTQETEFTDE